MRRRTTSRDIAEANHTDAKIIYKALLCFVYRSALARPGTRASASTHEGTVSGCRSSRCVYRANFCFKRWPMCLPRMETRCVIASLFTVPSSSSVPSARASCQELEFLKVSGTIWKNVSTSLKLNKSGLRRKVPLLRTDVVAFGRKIRVCLQSRCPSNSGDPAISTQTSACTLATTNPAALRYHSARNDQTSRLQRA